MLVKLNIVNKNHKVLFQTRITHGDEDHTLLKFLQSVHLDDGSEIDAALVLKCISYLHTLWGFEKKKSNCEKTNTKRTEVKE